MNDGSPGCWAPPAGDGVAGAAEVEVAPDGAGAWGAAGVVVAGPEGVEGACDGVAVEEAALGYSSQVSHYRGNLSIE